MKKILYTILAFIIIFLVSVITILSTIGYETNKFNKIIAEKINKDNDNLTIKIEKIKFKFDIKKFNLFLNTNDPELIYHNQSLPIKTIKVYLDLSTLIQSQPKIKRVDVISTEIEIEKLKKILIKTKPSNLNSFVMNRVTKGKIETNLEIYLDDDFEINNFIARGKAKQINTIINDKLELKDISFEFFADSSDILIKKIIAKSDGLFLKEGNIQIQKEENINIKSDFITNINLNKKNIKNYLFLFKKISNTEEENYLESKLNHNLNIVFDNTFKITNYEYSNNGKINQLFYRLNKPIKNLVFDDQINSISLKNSEVSARYSLEGKNFLKAKGTYMSNNDTKYNKFNLETFFSKNFYNTKLSFDFIQKLNFEFINYIKDTGKIANINLDFTKKLDNLTFNKINYTESNNSFLIENLKLSKNDFNSIKKFYVRTFEKDVLKNDFTISFGKEIKISGKKYDANNLNKIINRNSSGNPLKRISKDIKIELEEISTPLSKKLINFRLIGSIKNGKFKKITSKGDFGDDKYLDISLKSEGKNSKKYLEIYSDLPQPLLSEYSFFKGLSGGTLIFSSIIEGNSSISKLVINNFKIINAPGVVKLLSLADFGGLADLAEGEGLSFEKMEINMSQNKSFLKLEELYAVGPSISVLMEGYRDSSGLTSLRGTLVPAKNLNKLLSKIPVIGKIIIPKETGDGLFGVSFKMKGPVGKIKTSINPIKTLTPRFITRALEKVKKTK